MTMRGGRRRRAGRREPPDVEADLQETDVECEGTQSCTGTWRRQSQASGERQAEWLTQRRATDEDVSGGGPDSPGSLVRFVVQDSQEEDASLVSLRASDSVTSVPETPPCGQLSPDTLLRKVEGASKQKRAAEYRGAKRERQRVVPSTPLVSTASYSAVSDPVPGRREPPLWGHTSDEDALGAISRGLAAVKDYVVRTEVLLDVLMKRVAERGEAGGLVFSGGRTKRGREVAGTEAQLASPWTEQRETEAQGQRNGRDTEDNVSEESDSDQPLVRRWQKKRRTGGSRVEVEQSDAEEVSC